MIRPISDFNGCDESMTPDVNGRFVARENVVAAVREPVDLDFRSRGTSPSSKGHRYDIPEIPFAECASATSTAGLPFDRRELRCHESMLSASSVPSIGSLPTSTAGDGSNASATNTSDLHQSAFAAAHRSGVTIFCPAYNTNSRTLLTVAGKRKSNIAYPDNWREQRVAWTRKKREVGFHYLRDNLAGNSSQLMAIWTCVIQLREKTSWTRSCHFTNACRNAIFFDVLLLQIRSSYSSKGSHCFALNVVCCCCDGWAFISKQ